VDYDEWAPFYARIVLDFGFDPAQDEAAAHDLAQALGRPGYAPKQVWDELAAQLRGRDVIVLGAADDAASRLRTSPTEEPIIAADGATTASLEAGRRPALIVSDLDGDVADEVRAVADGAHILVHAHGDNWSAVQEWLPRFRKAGVAGTCQTRPVPPLQNHGGFTDGDRACFIAHALGVRKMRLVGFRFEGPPGRYSGTYDPATKPRKLQWSQRLLKELSRRGALIEFA
jgi:2-amino-4-hydroxy-6-hydroxymethyldihydropteridine diphosphokinase